MKQQITKGAIQASFLKLLEQKPFGKITVRDIVEDCGLTRNTFYYYYNDIYDIVDEILRQSIEAEIDRSIENESISLGDMFISAVVSIKNNQRLLRNLLNSHKTDELVRYFDRAVELLINHYIDSFLRGDEISPDDRRLIRDYCVHIFRGWVWKWVAQDMSFALDKDAQRIAYLFEGTVQTAIERSKKG